MADKEKIRAEVERLITDLGEQRDVLLEELLEFIDSLPEEPHQELYNKLSNLRDDAFSNTTKESWEACLSEEPVSEELKEAFKQSFEKVKEETLCVYDYHAGFVDGVNWHKDQMMAKSVDVTVHIEAGNYPYIPQIELYDYDKDIPLAKEGDKYKVILIKEE